MIGALFIVLVFVIAFLVVTEMALAVVLLAGAGLMIRSFLKLQATNVGVNVRNMLVMRLFLPEEYLLAGPGGVSVFGLKESANWTLYATFNGTGASTTKKIWPA